MDNLELFSTVQSTLDELQAEAGDQNARVLDSAARDANVVPWDEVGASEPVRTTFEREFPDGLYSHQAAAIQHLGRGSNVVVTTPTSSGKSLIYTVAIVEAAIEHTDATAMCLFPTKALSNDQFANIERRFSAVMEAIGRTCPPHTVARYDGSTPREVRPAIRQAVRVLLTNPDQAHAAILQWHAQHWQRFLKNLRYVVLDEAHVYRGTFGTNVAMLMRRLHLLCARYGSKPQFIASSATMDQAALHLLHLTGRPFEVVGQDADGSHQGPKRFWIVRPTQHAFATARAILQRLVAQSISVIAFCLSRWSTEENAEHFCDDPDRRIRVYRAGLLAAERESTEEGLRTGSILGVFSTSALELGIDIGLLDVCVCIGLPNTMMSLWQRAGRVGRQGRAGAVILIPEARPLDAYYAERPAELFERPNEPPAINLHSRSLAIWHYACALKEANDDRDLVKPEDLGPPMEFVARAYERGKWDDSMLHGDDRHMVYNLRAGADTGYELRLDDQKIGEISRYHLAREAAPNAIYRHDAERYRVIRIREKEKRVILRREPRFNKTQAGVTRRVEVLHCKGLRQNRTIELQECDRLRVTEWLVNLVERQPDGTVVRNWPGSQGLGPQVLPTSGVLLIVRDPLAAVDGYDAQGGSSETVAQEAWNGIGTLLTGMLPTVLGPCDIGDFAVHSEWNRQNARLFLYDDAYDGIDLTLSAFERMEDLLSAAATRVQVCRCTDRAGCFRCVRHPYQEMFTSRAATEQLVRYLLAAIEADPLETTFREQTTQFSMDTDPEASRCPACQHQNDISARFCNECGSQLAQEA